MLSTVQHDFPKEAPEVQMFFPWGDMRHAAHHDDLTNLANRRCLKTHLRSPAMLAGIARGVVGVLVIDIDNLKEVNARFGHGAGDVAICHVADTLRAQSGSDDLVGRTGGDEFTVILQEVVDLSVLERVGRRIIERIEVPVPFNDALCRISASIGTVWIQNSKAATRETVLEDADIALYASKNKGRAQQTFYTPALRETANATTPPKGRGEKKV